MKMNNVVQEKNLTEDHRSDENLKLLTTIEYEHDGERTKFVSIFNSVLQENMYMRKVTISI